MKRRIKKKIFKKKYDRPLQKFETDIQTLKEMEKIIVLNSNLQHSVMTHSASAGK